MQWCTMLVKLTTTTKKAVLEMSLPCFCVSCPSACLTGREARLMNEMACVGFYRAGKEVSKRERGRKGSVNRRVIQAESEVTPPPPNALDGKTQSCPSRSSDLPE